MKISDIFLTESSVCSIENNSVLLPDSYACDDTCWYYRIAHIGARRGLRFIPKDFRDPPTFTYEGETFTRANRLALPDDFSRMFQDESQVDVIGIGFFFEVYPLQKSPHGLGS